MTDKQYSNSTTDVAEPYNGWVLRKVYFEDGEPLMHSEPENTQSQELFGKTEQLEAEIKRLQEREWVGLTDQEINDCLTFNFETICRNVEAKLKEKNT